MAYQINRYDGSVLTVVEDGSIDKTTGLSLVGKNFAGYGEIQNENFVYLLENFASPQRPKTPLAGQVWFDSSSSKLKFFDGETFKTTGGAELGSEEPGGLTQGDFWWDTENEQLFAFNGTDFVLIGPQNPGEGITQFQTRSITGTDGITRSVIASVIDDKIISIISNEEFEIKPTTGNQIDGFDTVYQGVTLVDTGSVTQGVTSSNYVFRGTATNAKQLGGIDADQFVTKGSSTFDSLVEFSDTGVAIGDSLDLRIKIENDNQAVIGNEVGDRIKFRVKDAGANKTPLVVFANRILPSNSDAIDLGSSSSKFETVYAKDFQGTASEAAKLQLGSEDRQGSINPDANSVAVRTATGDLKANLFDGIALKAKYADLAEIYTTPQTLPQGTVVSVCRHAEHEVCGLESHGVAGVISENPAYLMNSEARGQPVAFTGRLGVRVIGKVYKGDKVYAAGEGLASSHYGPGDLVGIALESSNNASEKLIECVLKV